MSEEQLVTLSTLDGWIPPVGALVWQTIFNPFWPAHDSTVQERIAAGDQGNRHLTRVLGITENHNGRPGITRFHTRDDGSGPGLFPTKGHGPSWTESDWSVLEDAAAEEGALF